MTEPDTGPGSPWASPAAAPPAPVWDAPAAPAASTWDAPAAPAPAWGAAPVPPQGWGPAQPAVPPQGWGPAQPPPGWGPAAPYAPSPYGPVPGGPWAVPRTNPLSVIALVTGLIGLFPVAIPVAVVALVRLRRLPDRGRGLAIGGLVAATCWLVIAVLVVVGILVGTGGSSSVGRVAQAGSTDVGACLMTGGPVDAAVPCTATHDEEVYLMDVFEGGDFPGADELAAEADDGCYSSFRAYVGRSYENSTYDYAFYVPDAAEWRAGERRFVCVIVPTDTDTLLGVVAGSRA